MKNAKKLLILAFIGFFFAQLIDGALGMAYGVSSSSLLLAFGIAPAVASASVHLSEVATTAASGISHIKFGNVDRKKWSTVLSFLDQSAHLQEHAFFEQPAWRCCQTVCIHILNASWILCVVSLSVCVS
ncbi:hypothetical protein GCM10020331_081760 [Ectobacillus funiculus]